MVVSPFIVVLIAVPVLDRVWCGQPSAVLWKDQLFVSTNGRLNRSMGGLYRGTFYVDQKPVLSPTRYETRVSTLGPHVTKLDLRDGRLLFYALGDFFFYIVPMGEVPGLEPNEFGEAILSARGYKSQSHLLDRYSGEPRPLLFPDHRPADVFPPPIPKNGLISPKPGAREFDYRATMYTFRARCDLQIAGPKSVRLFHAYKDQLYISIEPDYLRAWYYDEKNQPIKNPPIPDRQLRTGKLPQGFTDYFAVYTSGEHDYMVSDDGKVYLVVPKGKTELEITELWNNPHRKIVGVLQDQTNNAIYGWGYSGATGSAERFYVKFDPKPVAVGYRLSVPMWGDVSDAYLESFECARAFQMANEKK